MAAQQAGRSSPQSKRMHVRQHACSDAHTSHTTCTHLSLPPLRTNTRSSLSSVLPPGSAAVLNRLLPPPGQQACEVKGAARGTDQILLVLCCMRWTLTQQHAGHTHKLAASMQQMQRTHARMPRNAHAARTRQALVVDELAGRACGAAARQQHFEVAGAKVGPLCAKRCIGAAGRQAGCCGWQQMVVLCCAHGCKHVSAFVAAYRMLHGVDTQPCGHAARRIDACAAPLHPRARTVSGPSTIAIWSLATLGSLCGRWLMSPSGLRMQKQASAMQRRHGASAARRSNGSNERMTHARVGMACGTAAPLPRG